MCIGVCLPFILQYTSRSYRSAFWNLGVRGHRDVPHFLRPHKRAVICVWVSEWTRLGLLGAAECENLASSAWGKLPSQQMR